MDKIHWSNEMIIKIFYILYVYFICNDNICQELINCLPFCPPSRSFFKLSYVGQTELVQESFETLSLNNMSITQSYPFFSNQVFHMAFSAHTASHLFIKQLLGAFSLLSTVLHAECLTLSQSQPLTQSPLYLFITSCQDYPNSFIYYYSQTIQLPSLFPLLTPYN